MENSFINPAGGFTTTSIRPHSLADLEVLLSVWQKRRDRAEQEMATASAAMNDIENRILRLKRYEVR